MAISTSIRTFISSSLICTQVSALLEVAKNSDLKGVQSTLSTGENIEISGKKGGGHWCIDVDG